MSTVEIPTPHGPARALLDVAESPVGALVLGHGAGGGVEAPDLVVARDVAVAESFSVARVEQPYRVAGKRSQPAASTVDSAWIAAVEHLRAGALADLPLIVGGRSAGARIACRTAAETGAAAVLCLAFPLKPPARRNGKESPSRLDELEAVDVPALVVQGERDRFGVPPEGPSRTVAVVPGDHGLKADRDAIADAVRGWLRTGTIVPV